MDRSRRRGFNAALYTGTRNFSYAFVAPELNDLAIALALFATGFAATAFVIPPLARLAPRLRLMDLPGGRKAHAGAVPLVGGIAMMAVFVALYFGFGLQRAVTIYLPAAVLIMTVGGMLDDRRELSPVPKFGVQIVAALVLAQLGGAMLFHLGDLVRPGVLALGALALPFTVFAIVGVMNAINMADGIDGLAGGLALVAALAFAGCAAVAGKSGPLWVSAALTGVLAGFLIHNLRWTSTRRARVFMGDGGSYSVGLVLAWIAITLAMDEAPALAPMTAVWILGIPLADTVVMLMRRILRGKLPFGADTGHLHHLLLARGMGVAGATWLMLAVAAVMALVGIAAWRADVSDYVLFYGYGAMWIVLYVRSSYATRAQLQAERAAGRGHGPGKMRGGARPDSIGQAR